VKESERPRADLTRLLNLVARLRAPDGCPWDREQTLSDARAYLLEEAHETAAALDRAVEEGDFSELSGELGDLLFQAAFIARLAEEAGAFTLGEVIAGVYDKMVERHPHVFGDEKADDAEAVRRAWERRKLAAEPERESLLAGVPRSLPALTGAYRMTQKAAGVGFDWPGIDPVFDKLREEIGEIREALREGGREGERRSEDREALAEEIGDLLFTTVNLARKLAVDPEAALGRTNLKFRRRFEYIERRVAEQGRGLGESNLAEMDALWEEAKARQR